MTYNLLPHEEDLIIAMRNNLTMLLNLIEEKINAESV